VSQRCIFTKIASPNALVWSKIYFHILLHLRKSSLPHTTGNIVSLPWAFSLPWAKCQAHVKQCLLLWAYNLAHGKHKTHNGNLKSRHKVNIHRQSCCCRELVDQAHDKEVDIQWQPLAVTTVSLVRPLCHEPSAKLTAKRLIHSDSPSPWWPCAGPSSLPWAVAGSQETACIAVS
jgi:hypothetical protein